MAPRLFRLQTRDCNNKEYCQLSTPPPEATTAPSTRPGSLHESATTTTTTTTKESEGLRRWKRLVPRKTKSCVNLKTADTAAREGPPEKVPELPETVKSSRRPDKSGWTEVLDWFYAGTRQVGYLVI
jgi:hypothetical protein